MKYFAIIIYALLILPLYGKNTDDKITADKLNVTPGVSWQLAQYRKENISNIIYTLNFNIPTLPQLAIKAKEKITFDLKNIDDDLQIDFKEDSNKILKISANGKNIKTIHYNEHIVIDKKYLTVGQNKISILFIAGNDALNRNSNYMYTLFVPDRMRTAFPSFDQPNLKAKFDLTLDISTSWKTVSSAPIRSRSIKNNRSLVIFERSDLISTYLFSFAAGRFNEIKRTIDGREMTMLHREPDPKKIARNVDEIFKLHKASIDYMEQYTNIKFPFKKFAFILIPSFQFGGMEHVGAIQYKASTLMLDQNPPQTDLLSRASLIGHETAHMWFGDLVTMDWFNDVWTKEVFANFMSAKLVNPSFPDIDHQLRSHLQLHPGAYGVDRSEGSNPIRQNLSNLNEAGSMYGAIIYNKAPIMMKQLEVMLGADNFRDGIREYLKIYSFSNATWPDLIKILNKRSKLDLIKWSDTWVNSAGRPIFNVIKNDNGISISQSDPDKKSRSWPQSFKIKNGVKDFDISIAEKSIDIKIDNDSVVLINADGMGYGLFPIEKDLLQQKWHDLNDLEKAAAFVSLYEQLLENNGVISPYEYIELIIWAMKRIDNPLLINHLIRQLTPIYWSYLSDYDRDKIAPALENIFWKAINDADNSVGIKKIYFRGYFNIAMSDQALDRLMNIWTKSLNIDGLVLATRDYTNLAATLAIKRPDQAEYIIKSHADRIISPDDQRRFEFIRLALSPDPYIRDKFFKAIKNKQNRHTEAWVLTALNYLHHPLRLQDSEKYLKESLQLLQEIQSTGDLFFPGRWVSANFKNYRSDNAVNIVRSFLAAHPDYNDQLKLKILQGADQLFRANRFLKSK